MTIIIFALMVMVMAIISKVMVVMSGCNIHFLEEMGYIIRGQNLYYILKMRPAIFHYALIGSLIFVDQ